MVGKGKLIAFFVFLILLVSSVALAHSMTREEMYVGGIGPGCTLGYVQEVYGEPMDKKEFAEKIVQTGETYLDIFPNGKARTSVQNAINQAKAEL